MTLLDVLKLVRHYLKLCIVIVVVCTLLGGALGLSKTYLGKAEYSAEAVLTASEPTSTVSANELMPLLQATANNVIAANMREGVEVSQEYDLTSRSITFAATAASEAESVEAANSTALQTAEQMRDLLDDLAQKYRAERASMDEGALTSDGGVTVETPDSDRAAALEAVSFTINDASQAAANSGKSTLVKYALVGLLGGLFLAVCVIVVIDLAKMSIKGRGDIEKAFEVSVLANEADGNFGQRLWANIQFVLSAEPHSVCLIPVGSVDAGSVELQLRDAVAQKGLQLQASTGEMGGSAFPANVVIVACEPLSESMSAAFDARRADVTVVLAECWVDSLRQVSDTLRELQIADVETYGIALLGKEW